MVDSDPDREEAVAGNEGLEQQKKDPQPGDGQLEEIRLLYKYCMMKRNPTAVGAQQQQQPGTEVQPTSEERTEIPRNSSMLGMSGSMIDMMKMSDIPSI